MDEPILSTGKDEQRIRTLTAELYKAYTHITVERAREMAIELIRWHEEGESSIPGSFIEYVIRYNSRR